MTEQQQPGANDVGLETDDEDEELEIVTLVDDDGGERNFVKVDEIEVDGQPYGLFIDEDDYDDDNPEPETIVLRIEGDEYALIEDEAEVARVAAKLDELAGEEDEG